MKPLKFMLTSILGLALCAACGGEARVPFEPKSDRPVYCSECFAKMRDQQR